MKWQKDYLDVPADDYLTSEDYICSMGFPLDYKPPLNDLIGPHENRYMNLMRIGHKPIALLFDHELKFWRDEITKREWKIEYFEFDVHWGKTVREYVVYLPGQEWRVDRLRRCFQAIKHGPWPKVEEIRIGFLLGYTKQCINAYIKRMVFIKSGDLEGASASHLNHIPRTIQSTGG